MLTTARETLVALFWPRRTHTRLPSASLTINPHPNTHIIDERYLSFAIDISVLAGGFWWEGSNTIRKGLGGLRVQPLALDSKKLDRLVQALGPAYVRVGGSEADKIHYFEDPTQDSESLILTKEIWDDLHAFIQRNNLAFAFTFKYGLFKRKFHGDWQASEAEKLLRYSQQKGYRMDVCELGNELNAYWAFHGINAQPGAKKLAQDYGTFRSVIHQFYPNTKVIGPGSAFWPKLGETIKPFSNITRRFLSHLQEDIDIVDWHYYPFQSSRAPIRTRSAKPESFINPKNLDDFQRYSLQLKAWRDELQPQAALWTGESGSAQCGGEAKASDRWASCFWWADQLGNGAKLGQAVMIRQSLIGGEYGLVDRLTLKPRPDYWLSWIWGQLMGQQVHVVNTSSPFLRAYCHSLKKQTELSESRKCLLLINLNKHSLAVNPELAEACEAQYALTAKKLTSKRIKINGKRPKFKKGKVKLEEFCAGPVSNILKPLSINFWILSRIPQSIELDPSAPSNKMSAETPQ